jgi:hypothetical protein
MGDGAQKVVGTSQTQEQFWRGVMEIFFKKAPEQNLSLMMSFQVVVSSTVLKLVSILQTRKD